MAAAGDNASRKTASTGVCETSQTEYISKSKDDDDDDDEEESGDGKSQEKRSDDKEEEKAGMKGKMEEMAQMNVKMLFLHNEQVRIAEVSIKDVICLDTKLPLLTSRCL